MGKNALSEVRLQYLNNNPPIEVNQRWICFNKEGEVYRRVRILAIHPDLDKSGKRQLIYVDEPAKLKLFSYGTPRICPEFNLRYIFELDDTD